MTFTIFMKAETRQRTALRDRELALAMAEVQRVIDDEPYYASRSYLIQRVSRYFPTVDASTKVNNLIKMKAIRSVPGSRRGFPTVYIKGESWNRVWTECNSEQMDFETLKKMNQV